jgi:N-acetylglutamate synthase-like GNAT family acetyltransferase
MLPVGHHRRASVGAATVRVPRVLHCRRVAVRAPASPYYSGMVAVVCLWFAAGPVPLIVGQPEAMQMRMAREPWAVPVALTNLAGLVVIAVVAFAVDRPYVLVSASGIRIQRLLRRTELAWQDLAPGWPVGPPGRGGDVRLWRGRAHPEGPPRPVCLPASRLHVDAGFLADVVRQYAEHPERRAEIGTQAGLDRLRAGHAGALGTPGAPIVSGQDPAVGGRTPMEPVPSPGFTVRTADAGDGAAIAALVGEMGYQVDADDVRRRLASLTGEHAVLVATRGDEVVGWVHGVHARSLIAGDRVEIAGLAVAPDWAGRGAGTALLAAVERWAVEHHLSTAYLRSRSDRSAAHQFYRHRGYRELKTQYAFGKELDANGTLARPVSPE